MAISQTGIVRFAVAASAIAVLAPWRIGEPAVASNIDRLPASVEAGSPASDPPLAGLDPEQVVDNFASLTYAGTYGGLVSENHGGRALVYLTSTSPAVESAIQRSAGSFPIDFKLTNTTMGQLNDLHAFVQREWDALDKRGIRLNAAWPDVPSGTEMLEVISPTSDQISYLESVFGANSVTIKATTEQAARSYHTFISRTNDFSPWNGGDAITDHLGGCTSGFGVHLADGTKRLLTAGHCFSLGADVYNAVRCDDSGCPQNGTLMGHVTRRGWNDTCKNTHAASCTDTEIMSAPGSATIFRGPPGSPYGQVVDGTATNFVNDWVCQSGAYFGETCNWEIAAVNVCRDLADPTDPGYHHICGLMDADGPANGAGEGDSGGPVYKFVNGQLRAVGTVSGGDPAGIMLFTGWGSIDSFYGDISINKSS